jgi:hypothetical protein
VLKYEVRTYCERTVQKYRPLLFIPACSVSSEYKIRLAGAGANMVHCTCVGPWVSHPDLDILTTSRISSENMKTPFVPKNVLPAFAAGTKSYVSGQN